jgi:hypothetical protein
MILPSPYPNFQGSSVGRALRVVSPSLFRQPREPPISGMFLRYECIQQTRFKVVKSPWPYVDAYTPRIA